MSDFETRLRETLRDRAGDAPIAPGLAAGARRRLRRRRTTIAGAGVLAGVAILAPFLLNQSDPPSRGVDDIATNPTSPAVVERTDGLRTESWHDVTFRVPDDWGYGSPTTQCISSYSFPTVGRPGDVVPSIGCAEPGFGATIGSSAAYDPVYESGHVWRYDTEGVDEPTFPDNAWLGTWYDDEVAVTVATPDRKLTEQILASVHLIDGVDDNGCEATFGSNYVEAPVTDFTSVCDFDAEGRLEWSRQLGDAEGAALDEAIQAAPMRTIDYDCPTEDKHSRTVVLEGGFYRATVVTDSMTCEGWNGIFLSGVVREVTPELTALLERPTLVGN